MTLIHPARGWSVSWSVMEQAISSMKGSKLSSMATSTPTHRDYCATHFQSRSRPHWWWSCSTVRESFPHPPRNYRPMISCCCCRRSTLEASTCSYWKGFCDSGTEVWGEMAVAGSSASDGATGARETNDSTVAVGWLALEEAFHRRRDSAPAPAADPWSLDLVIWSVAPASPAGTLPEATATCSASHKQWRLLPNERCRPDNATALLSLFCGLPLQEKEKQNVKEFALSAQGKHIQFPQLSMPEIVSNRKKPLATRRANEKPNNGLKIQRLLKVVRFSTFHFAQSIYAAFVCVFIAAFASHSFYSDFLCTAPTPTLENRKFNVELNTEKLHEVKLVQLKWNFADWELTCDREGNEWWLFGQSWLVS